LSRRRRRSCRGDAQLGETAIRGASARPDLRGHLEQRIQFVRQRADIGRASHARLIGLPEVRPNLRPPPIGQLITLEVRWTLRWREMDSNHRFLARKSRFLLWKANCGDRTGVAKKGCFFMRYRWFESISLQRRVRCEPVSRGNSPSYVEKPRFSASVRAGASGAVGRDAQDTATSGLRAVISLSGYIPVPHRRWVIFEFGSGFDCRRDQTACQRGGSAAEFFCNRCAGRRCRPQDVFISHAWCDKRAADAACSTRRTQSRPHRQPSRGLATGEPTTVVRENSQRLKVED